MGLTIGVLGPLAAADDGGALTLSRARERAVLTALALAYPAPVSVAALTAALWGPEADIGSPQTVRSYVSRLRHVLGADHLVSGPQGYALAVEPSAIDARRFELLVDDAALALRVGDLDGSRRAGELAVELWRGEPYLELATPEADDERRRLVGVRRRGVATLAEARLGLGRPAAAADLLAPECAAAPLEEDLWALWIRALHADGRRAEALRRYDELRRALGGELGIEPGALVQQAHLAVLRDTRSGAGGENAGEVVPRYVHRDGRAIGYAVLGHHGPPLLFLSGMFVPFEMLLEEPSAAAFVHRLAAGRRLLLVDPGSIGLSDPTPEDQLNYDGWSADVLALLDDLAIQSLPVVAAGIGVGVALHLAQKAPHRVDRLVLGSGPLGRPLPDHTLDDMLKQIDAGPGGEGSSTAFLAPSRMGDAAFSAWLDRGGRRGARPSTARAIFRMIYSTDVLGVASQVTTPALVIARRDTIASGEDAALAAALPAATLVVHDGADLLPFVGDVDRWLDEALDFIDGSPATPPTARLMAVAATCSAGGSPIVTVHDLPEAALAAATDRARASAGTCRALLHLGVVFVGPSPSGPAVDEALRLLAATAADGVTCSAAFRAVADGQVPVTPAS